MGDCSLREGRETDSKSRQASRYRSSDGHVWLQSDKGRTGQTECLLGRGTEQVEWEIVWEQRWHRARNLNRITHGEADSREFHM